MKILNLVIILISGVILSGCLKTVDELGWGNFDRPSPSPGIIEPTPVVPKEDLGVVRVRKIGIAECDAYLNYMVCATSQMSTVTAEQIMEEITKDWSQTETEVLTIECKQTLKEIQESPQQYSNGVDCTI